MLLSHGDPGQSEACPDLEMDDLNSNAILDHHPLNLVGEIKPDQDLSAMISEPKIPAVP